MVKFSVLTHL